MNPVFAKAGLVPAFCVGGRNFRRNFRDTQTSGNFRDTHSCSHMWLSEFERSEFEHRPSRDAAAATRRRYDSTALVGNVSR